MLGVPAGLYAVRLRLIGRRAVARVGAGDVALQAMGLEPGPPPDPVHRHVVESQARRQAARGPVGKRRWRGLLGEGEDLRFERRGTRSPRPLRGASCRPATRRRSNRLRHRVSVVVLTSNRAARAAYGSPAASARIIRARSTRPAARVRERAIASSSVRSRSERTSGYGEVNMAQDTNAAPSTQP